MLTSTALVMFMMPGLALFYGGLVAQRTWSPRWSQSFVAIGVISVLWALVGYTLAFGPDHGGVVGGLKYLGLHDVNGPRPQPVRTDDPLALSTWPSR